jgi:hypothetical protein
VKTLGIIAITMALMLGQGCTHNDRDSAGLKRLPGAPPEEESRVPLPNGGQAGTHIDPAANGGSSLTAAAPYSGSGAAVPQNVNPGPFLVASQAAAGTQHGPSTNPSILTRSADGTMSGPNDLPAATTGWGTSAADYSGSSTTAKTSTKKPSPPK